ncbi:MAG TPA: MAPEG family protein [Xanthobacteraceae bacterium]|jgi:hypothetical protein
MMFEAILIPLFVQVALVFGLLIWMCVRRGGDFRSGAVDPDKVALREPLYPERTTQAAYAYSNQFELPVLFYVLVALLIATRHADLIFVVLAWVFVITRLIQAGIHVTSNVIRWRGLAFGAGAIVLLVMWIIYAVEILTGT